MNYSAFVLGFAMALIAVMVVLLIRLSVKTKLDSWGYELTRQTHNQLRDTNLKLDSIKYQQERLLSGLERLQSAASTQTSTLNDLRSRLSQSKTAV
jgi:hypothetical protein